MHYWKLFTCENPDLNEEEETVLADVTEDIVWDDDIDILLLDEDWKDEEDCDTWLDCIEEKEDFMESTEDWNAFCCIWFAPKDSADSSWKLESCLDSFWIEVDSLCWALEKLMLPLFC